MVDGRLTEVARTWVSGLAGITGEQIAVGLMACCDMSDSWPPTLPGFRAACLGKKDYSGGDRHYCPTYNGPVHERITDRSKLLSSDDRDAQRAKNREHVAKMKAALKGGS